MGSGVIKARVDESGFLEDCDWFCCPPFIWFWDTSPCWECYWDVGPRETGGGMTVLEFV